MLCVEPSPSEVAVSTRCVVLLRGINVGRHHRLAMADLRRALEDAGCRSVTTYLQSGNAVVEADPDGLAARVEAALPLPVRVLVRTAAELTAVVAACPWPERAAASPKLVHVAFLEHPPEQRAAELLSGRHGDDEIVCGDRVLYLSYSVSSLDSPLGKVLDAARLEGVVTVRNWSTVSRLATLAAG